MGWLGPACRRERRSLGRAFQPELQIKPFVPVAKTPRLRQRDYRNRPQLI
jgi:hypothetical protein